jgi:hypothetical protein
MKDSGNYEKSAMLGLFPQGIFARIGSNACAFHLM